MGYYDPALGRFINADAYADTGQSVLGTNMFAYCLNNPVNMVDPYGELPFFIVTAFIGAVVGAVVGGVVAAANGGNVLAGVAIGATAGALIGSGVGMVAGATLAGSAFATTSAVVAGANMLAVTVSSGGLAAGTNFVANNVTRALGGPVQVVVQAPMRTAVSNPSIDPNKLKHIFGNVGHKLSGFLNSYNGNQTNAFNAVQNAIDKVKLPNGVFNQVAVKVNGYTIYVNGIVENGTKKIGTFFIK